MNGPDRTRDPREMVERLVQILELRSTPGGDDLLVRARTALDGTAAGEELVDLLGESVIGDDDWAEADAGAPAATAAVAAVLDRIDGSPAPDAAADRAWLDEMGRLLRLHDADPDSDADTDTRTDTELAERALDEPDLAEAAVERAGVPWDSSGMKGLYQAARRYRTGGHGTGELDVSGLTGARTLHPAAVLTELEAPLDDLPRVRGRDRLIARIAGAVLRGDRRPRVLVAPAGYGKSTVALAVARRVRAEGVITLRIAAETREELLDGLYLAAVALRSPLDGLRAARARPPVQRAAALWELLDHASEPWLLVLDGAGPDAVGVAAWVPVPRAGSVVVTTRHGGPGRWGPDADVVSLERLRPEQGGLVVLDRIGAPRTGPSVDRARVVSRVFGGVPLALSSAGRYAAALGSAEPLSDLLVQVGTHQVRDPVTTVYELGVRPDSDADRRTAIRLLACFAPDTPLPLAVLDGYAGVVGAPRPMLDDLVRTGLVEERAARAGIHGVIAIHPALADESRHDAIGIAREVVDGWAIELLTRHVRGLDAGAPAGWPTLRMLEPHVQELLRSPAVTEGDLLAAAVTLAERAGAALLRAGSRAAAYDMLAAAAQRSGPLDPDHPALLALRHTRARMAALDGGDFAVAAAELHDVIERRTRVLGARHPDTLDSRDALAWVTAERGLPTRARDALVEVLAARREVLGPDHPDTLETQHRLAWVDALTGRDTEALAELSHVLNRRVLLLGRYHLDVFGTRYRLAWTLAKHADHVAAEQAYRDLLADVEHVLGRLHPMTLMVRVRIGWTLVWAHRFDEAERIYGEVLAEQERVLGPTHRRVLQTRHFLACLALDRGDIRRAAEQMESVLAERERRLGPDHPHTLDSRSYLTTARMQAGEYDAADRIFQSIVADRERVLGGDHEVTLRSRYLLARARMRRGLLDEAGVMLDRLLTDVRAALPEHNRVVLDVRHTRAVVEGLLGRPDAAEAELRAVLEMREWALGPDHRDTLGARDYLAWALGRQGRFAEGLEIARHVLADRERVLGPDHLHTFKSRYSVAWLLARLGDTDAAREAYEALLTDLRIRFDDDRPDVLRARHGLLRLRLRSGDPSVALAEAERLVADQTRLLGPDAVDTLRAVEDHGDVLVALPGREADGWAELERLHRRRALVLGPRHPDTVALGARLAQRS